MKKTTIDTQAFKSLVQNLTLVQYDVDEMHVASEALLVAQMLLSGTPYEQIITDAIFICEEIANAEPNEVL